jgi:hypothetical protein
MVTDERGYPLEFRATTPVKPSAIQRAIYGDRLDAFVGQELLAATLLKDSDLTPAFIATTDAVLQGVHAPTGCPIVRLRDASQGVVTAQSEALGQIVNRGRTLVYDVPAQNEVAVAEALAKSSDNFDLLATFERMKAAMSILEHEDERFR